MACNYCFTTVTIFRINSEFWKKGTFGWENRTSWVVGLLRVFSINFNHQTNKIKFPTLTTSVCPMWRRGDVVVCVIVPSGGRASRSGRAAPWSCVARTCCWRGWAGSSRGRPGAPRTAPSSSRPRSTAWRRATDAACESSPRVVLSLNLPTHFVTGILVLYAGA